MSFSVFQKLRTSAIAFAVTSLVAACGGGANGEDSAAIQSAVSSSPGAASAAESAVVSDVTVPDPAAASSEIADATASTSSAAGATETSALILAGAGISSTNASTSATASATVGSDTAPKLPTSTATSTSTPTPTPTPTDGSTDTVLAAASKTSVGVVATPVSGLPKAVPATSSSRSGVGVNVSPLDTSSPEIPSIDLMKRAGTWYVGCTTGNNSQCKGFTGAASGFDTLEEAKLDLDSQGWIRSLPAANDSTVKFRTASTVLSAGIAPDGKYVVRYDGAGTIAYSGVAVKVASQSTPGRDVVTVTNSSTGGFFMTITATTSGNYLRNIRVYPPGGACSGDYTTFAADATACTGNKGTFVPFESFPATQQWYPPFITDLKGFRTLRFMDLTRTNTTTLANWADRPLPTDRTWNGVYGMPVETAIDLSNDAGADPWLNLPPHATDDYVHQFAKLVHGRMAATRTLNLEYANETWNYAFTASAWMYNQAAAQWPAEVVKKTSVYTLQLSWYAQRLSQVCDIVKSEFGADASRVRCIANTQAGGYGAAQVLACPFAAAAMGKQCAKSIDVIAIAPYFGFYIGNAKMRSTINTWYADADGGMGKMFEEITGLDASGNPLTAAPLAAAGSGAPQGAMAFAQTLTVLTKAAADAYGKPMWAYEGGQHLIVPAGDSDTTFVNFEIAANRDPRMGAAYDQSMAEWKAAGGQTFVYYAHVGKPSKYGMWGLKEALTDTANPKWLAAMRARNGTACWWAGC